ncbi:MAG: 16S rRNA methyltransferase [Cellulomonas sp. 73-145]|uniref:class I SAM-dependent methyltransferase n=1 Tax=Cellulomonas sp. 73-145 TaxID=1895739 RepID=UPI00092AD77B|nr:methyltransferase [Cellulomonas sp. 73-145]OJV59517.1 MAG: 16S rRNA methyltransferase [Cellulomonas sp. 73-145]
MGEQEHYFTARPSSAADRRTIEVELAGRTVAVQTAGGVFSPDHVDLGTRVLLRSVPTPPTSGDLLDLGCGWGPLALTLALQSPDAHVWAVDVNERALDLVRRNAAALGLQNVTAVAPEAVPADVRFATVWSNPPVRVGKDELHALLQHWLTRLEPGGEAWLVVGRHLGADPLLRWLQEELGPDVRTERSGSAKGFRVLRAEAVRSGDDVVG